MNKILFVLLSLLTSLQSYSQEQNEKEVSFLLLGDIHYDLLEDHDMEWLSTKPDDLRQVTKEYSIFTKNTWPEFSRIISGKVQKHQPSIKAVLQMGDLSEGLAGSPQKQYRWLTVLFKAVNKMNMEVPFIMTKGNHDITGPGAKEALKKYTYPIWQGWQDIHPYSQPITLLLLMMYYLCVMIHGIGIRKGYNN